MRFCYGHLFIFVFVLALLYLGAKLHGLGWVGMGDWMLDMMLQ